MAASRRPRIFMSHSHKDNDFGILLVDDLRRAIGDESAVWYDSRGGLKGGDLWWPVICQELKRRNTFIVVLSPQSLKSPWVRKEMRMALMYHLQRNQKIIPILYQTCNIPDDFRDIQAISFLPDRTYQEAFQELQEALQLSKFSTNVKNISSLDDYRKDKLQPLVEEVEMAYRQDDWSGVIKKVNIIAKQYPEALLPSLYRMQAWAYYFEDRLPLAQDALGKGIKLIQDPQKQLSLLDVYTDQLVSNGQWNEILTYADEASRLDPHNSTWRVAKNDALEMVHNKHQQAGGQPLREEDVSEAQAENAHPEAEKETVKPPSDEKPNTHLQNQSREDSNLDQKIKEIELKKQQLTLKKEQFQFEKEIMTFACDMAERVSSLSTDKDSPTKALHLRSFLSQFLPLEENKES